MHNDSKHITGNSISTERQREKRREGIKTAWRTEMSLLAGYTMDCPQRKFKIIYIENKLWNFENIPEFKGTKESSPTMGTDSGEYSYQKNKSKVKQKISFSFPYILVLIYTFDF